MATVDPTERVWTESGQPIEGEREPRVTEPPPALAKLYAHVDGFYALGSAFLVRPWTSAGALHGVCEWNEPSLWKSLYPIDLTDVVFFAEDVFGYPFGLRLGTTAVVRFDVETGQLEPFARDIEHLFERVLAEPLEITGRSFLDEVERAGRSLCVGERLIPWTPFVLGGEFRTENLRVVHELEAMRIRGPLATALKDAPDGTTVILRLED